MKAKLLVLAVAAIAPAQAWAQSPQEPPAAVGATSVEDPNAAVATDFTAASREAPEGATADDDGYLSGGFAELSDPFEPFNRVIFRVNDVADRYVLEPAARGYRIVTPRFFRAGVNNFLANLGEPVTFANDVLQGAPGRAGATLGRFTINTTVGLAGLFNPARSAGFERHSEDFGQTLGVWGVGPGPYLVLPLLGPSTVRDAGGSIVDVGFRPTTYAEGEDIGEWRGVTGFTGALAGRERAIEVVENIRNSSPDPYVTFRSLYGQARASAIRNGRQDVEDLPDFGDVEPNGADAPAGADASAE